MTSIGPFPNFVLAPAYALNLGYWHLAGTFSDPSDDFPYGLHEPLQQLGLMILESRVIFLTLGLVMIGFLAYSMHRIETNSLAIALAVFFCIATNFTVGGVLASARPDSPMIACTAGALALFLRIVSDGLTPGRAFWMSLFAVFAISSKENAATVFVLPYLGLAWTGWRSSRASSEASARFWKSIAVGLLTGVIGYAMLNIVYAPSVWWSRMQYWLAGPGISGEISGAGSLMSPWDRFLIAVNAVTRNLGPGGVSVVAVALISGLWNRPKHFLLICLPAISALIGASRIPYAGDRFYTTTVLCLAAPVAVGLSPLLARLRSIPGRALAIAILGAPWS